MRGTDMKAVKIWTLALAGCIVFPLVSCSKEKARESPSFEFDIWGSAPRRVTQMTKDPSVQNILFAIREQPLTPEDIASLTNGQRREVQKVLEELEQFDVVIKKEDKWISNIPLYVKKEIEEGEKIGLKYAEREAAILRSEIPHLRDVYAQTRLSRDFPWDRVSLIIVGAFLADFCVVDRIPFKPENFTAELQPPLGKKDQKKWGYEGYEVVAKRFPSRKWKFYQNVVSHFAGGGARFGYFRNPDEQRKIPPSHPEDLLSGTKGKVLLALADGPLGREELMLRSRLDAVTLAKTLETLGAFNPPAIVLRGGQYTSTIPVLPKPDFELLLPELDRVAEIVFQKIVLDHMKERKTRAKELGFRWPLPADTYVRDKALQMLVEEGLLSPVQDPPVDWNFNVWGWQGFLAMHNEIVSGTHPPEPDPFIDSVASSQEIKALEEFRSLKKKILMGEEFADVSTPVRAFLTRMSGWHNCDLKALKAVEVPSDRIREGLFDQESSKTWGAYMSQLEISRVRLLDRKPKDGDLVPIFTTGGEGDTHIFFYYHGEWKALGNTSESEEYWRAGLDDLLNEKLAYLEAKGKTSH
jgi:predicted transcriptional regulator